MCVHVFIVHMRVCMQTLPVQVYVRLAAALTVRGGRLGPRRPPSVSHLAKAPPPQCPGL